MIEDMTVRNFVEETRNNYIRHVRIANYAASNGSLECLPIQVIIKSGPFVDV